MTNKSSDIIGAKAGATPSKPYIQQDTVGSTQTVEIVYGIGDGENEGLINGLNSIILDGTRVIGSSGEVNYTQVKFEERKGLIDQAALKLIEDTSVERTLNLEVRDEAPVVSSFNNNDVDKYVVRISIPTLMQNKDNGDSIATAVTYAIEAAVDGGAYSEILRNTVYEKITNGFEIDHEFDAPAGSLRTLRVRRITAASSSQLLVNKIFVAGITEVINAKFSHPTLHHIGLVFNAEQFNNIPKVVFHYKGRKIKVPTNYDPVTRKYTGIWNGTFKVVYSNNPAWVLYDILTDRRSGLGRRLTADLIDKWELYQIGIYCDELVPDGKGAQEPRFVCNNLILNSKQDAYQVIRDIASIFRGQSFWNGTQIITRADAPRDIDYAISMANVISYSYSGTASDARHNVVKAQYYDRDNENKAAYEYATDYASIRETESINELEVRAFGCDSAGQAQRLARYVLLSEQTETRILAAKVSLEGFVNMQLGDIFAWSDRFLAGADNGGRVVSVAGKVLTLDRAVTSSAKVGDTIFVNTASGKANTRKITAVDGNKVTLDTALATTEPEFVWVIDSVDLSLLYFKLDDYKVNTTDNTVDIVGIQHVASKYGTIDTETALEAPLFSKVEIETLRAPENVTINFNVKVEQGLNVADIYVAWQQVKGATRYTVEFRRENQSWRILGTVTGVTHTIENVTAGIYEVRVRASDSIGNASPFGYSSALPVSGEVLPPPALANIKAKGKLFAIQVDWAYPAGAEASLAAVIEYTNQDPTTIGAVTQKLNVTYPQTSFTFNGLSAHAKLWVRGAILDKYNQEGAYTSWINATADSQPDEILEIISGHITAGTLDQVLTDKIQVGVDAKAIADIAKTAADNAQSQANVSLANAAAAKVVADKSAADLLTKTTAINADIAGTVSTMNNGFTSIRTDFAEADFVVTGKIDAYKASNDAALATVATKAESAVTANSATASNVTALTTRLTTTEGNIATKAENSALTALDSKVTNIDGNVTSQGTAITALKNDLILANTALTTKASSAALQSLDNRVVSIDGAVTSTANAITALNGKVTTVENGLSTKAEASALNKYYTKEQADSATTGKIESYDASLVIGGTNLLKNSNFEGELGSSNWSNNAWGIWVKQQDSVHGTVLKCVNGSMTHDWVTVEEGATLVYSALVRSPVDRIMHLSVPLHCWAGKDSVQESKYEVLKKSHDVMPAGVWTKIWVVIKLTGDANSFKPFIYDVQPLNGLEIAWTKLEKGNKVTDWTPNDQEVQQSINANANAIQTVNVEVARVNGKVVSTAESVSNLSSNVGLLQGSINEVRQTVTNNQESTNTLVTSLRSGMADADDVSMMMRSATVVFEDLSFKNGWNGAQVYNNYANGALAGNFTDKLPDNPVASTRQLQFIHTGGATTPALGGYYQTVYSRANGVFLVKFVAKLPVGFSFGCAANAYGDGANSYFIGGNEGTGKFKTYYAVYRCGATGSFSTVGFVYVSGLQPTHENPLIWYLASSTVYDCLDNKVAPDSVVNGIAEAKRTASTAVNKAEATALIAQNLQTSLDNTNAKLSTDYYTYSKTDEAISKQITDLSATLDISVLPSKRDTTKANQWLLTHVVPRDAGWVSQGVKPDFSVLKTGIKNKRIYCADGNTSFSSSEYDNTVLYFRTIVYVDTNVEVNLGDFTGDDAHSIYINGVLNFNKSYYGSTANLILALKTGLNTIDVICYNGTGGAGFFSSVPLSSLVVNMYAPESVEEQAAATANAVSSLTTTVSNIDGVVTSQARQVTTLESSKSAIENGAIAGNDEYIVDLRDPAYDRALYYPVLLGGFSTEYRQTIRVMSTLNGLAIPPWSAHGGGFSLNAQFQMGGAGWGTIDPEVVTDNFTYAWTHSNIAPLDAIGHIVASSQPFFYVRGGGYYRLSKPVNRSVQVCAPNGSLSGYYGDTLSPRPYQESTVPKSINQGLNRQNVKLQQTNTVLDGVKAISTVTIDNNGVMSGYGLISELVDGRVTSAFGINADTFYVGSPTTGKKPFVVIGTGGGVINGVTVPAGTYIDTLMVADGTITRAHIKDLAVDSAKIADAAITTAKIGNAQITTAKIADLQVDSAKIANAAITTAKIGDLQVDTLKIKDDAVTVSVAAQNVSNLSIVTNGGKVRANFGLSYYYAVTGGDASNRLVIRVYRNNALIRTYSMRPSAVAITSVGSEGGGAAIATAFFSFTQELPMIVDAVPAGSYTYSVTLADPRYNGMYASAYLMESIALMEVKK